MGFWSALTLTAAGVVYAVVVGSYFAAHGLTLPPSEGLQTFGAVMTLLAAADMVVLMVSLCAVSASDRRILNWIALVFTALFAGAVSINRFVQLSVVRQRTAVGDTEGISWFLAYGPRSAMLALEMLGWCFFLGLACVFSGLSISGGRLETWIRWSFLTYGLLGFIGAVGFILASPVAGAGLVAWGVVLPVTTALLAIRFHRREPPV